MSEILEQYKNPDPDKKRDEVFDRAMAEKAKELLSDPRLKKMPSLFQGIRNGTFICAEKDMPEIGLRKGALMPIFFDRTYVRGTNLDGPTWSYDKLMEEFTKDKIWTVAAQLDEWLPVEDLAEKKD